MATIYYCDHCNREPLFIKNGRCPTCGNEVVKVNRKQGAEREKSINAKTGS